MKKIIERYIHDKKVLILGFGNEGQSTYRLLRKYFPDKKLFIADKRMDIQHKAAEEDKNTYFILGENYLSRCRDFDILIKTPGIPTRFISLQKNALLTSQTALFLEAYAKQTIGITGTKGKSTTTSLIAHILKINKRNVILAGNIGVPFFDIVEQVQKDTIIVCELSAHQLENISHSPYIAVLLNIFPEHLDHFSGYEPYKAAKLNIFSFQKANDIALTTDETLPKLKKINSKLFVLKHNETQGMLTYMHFRDRDKKEEHFNISLQKSSYLLGKHNELNILTATTICHMLGLSNQEIFPAISSFRALPHRLEFAAEVGGVKYYNDSISTIPQASIAAIEALGRVDVLILGGFDRGIDYQVLYDYLKEKAVRYIILYGTAGKRLMKECFESRKNGKYFTLFKDAVNYAKKVSKQNDICLLSPAASSYDQFKNFEERGDIFKEIIKE